MRSSLARLQVKQHLCDFANPQVSGLCSASRTPEQLLLVNIYHGNHRCPPASVRKGPPVCREAIGGRALARPCRPTAWRVRRTRAHSGGRRRPTTVRIMSVVSWPADAQRERRSTHAALPRRRDDWQPTSLPAQLVIWSGLLDNFSTAPQAGCSRSWRRLHRHASARRPAGGAQHAQQDERVGLRPTLP